MVLDSYLVVINLVHYDGIVPLTYLVKGANESEAIKEALFQCIEMPSDRSDPDMQYYIQVLENEVLEPLIKRRCVYTHQKRIQLAKVTYVQPEHLSIIEQYLS